MRKAHTFRDLAIEAGATRKMQGTMSSYYKAMVNHDMPQFAG